MPSPVLWGDEAMVRQRLGHGLSDLRMMKRHYRFAYDFPPVAVVELFRRYYGPVNQAFSALDREGQERLRRELETLWVTHNRSGADRTTVDAEYLEVIGIRDAWSLSRS